ncbi:hypothetical protein [Streptomyces rhizosphaerihabitans]|uniref:hypothetical protein n=1 Tax=Streptomyces rhizosphaerihabitans TaxID=1266770 RepID=UPI0021C17BCD|nr:hypothetical protein [Streptomyces rhizosphaerihabitans]MCT9011754.1 hypothetical protein [Streptomyces rhizosphaerihabitans]
MSPRLPVASDASEAVTPQTLRDQYESGATVDELVAASGLSYGTVLNRLHDAGDIVALALDAWLRAKGYPPDLTRPGTEVL